MVVRMGNVDEGVVLGGIGVFFYLSHLPPEAKNMSRPRKCGSSLIISSSQKFRSPLKISPLGTKNQQVLGMVLSTSEKHDWVNKIMFYLLWVTLKKLRSTPPKIGPRVS